MKDWISEFFENRVLAKIPKYNSTTGNLEFPPGTPIITPYSATIATLGSAASNSGIEYIVGNPGNNTNAIPCRVRSNGTRWDIVNGDAEILNEVPKLRVICPATTFTSVTASAGTGTNTLLTSAGVHGLTAASAVNSYMYISAGTGWDVTLHKITAIAVDTTGTTIEVSTVFNSQGSPTIALAGTELIIYKWNIPALTERGKVDYDITVDYDGSTGSKRVRVRHQDAGGPIGTGTILYDNNETTNSPVSRALGGFHNNGATNVQEGYNHQGSVSGVGNVNAGSSVTGAKQTNTATEMRINAVIATANDTIILNRVISRFSL